MQTMSHACLADAFQYHEALFMNRVAYLPAKPNPMFAPELTALLRFSRYQRAVPCVECGKKKKRHWTMLCPFRACESQGIVLADGPVRQPGEPCCTDHPLAPAIPAELIGCGDMDVPALEKIFATVAAELDRVDPTPLDPIGDGISPEPNTEAAHANPN